MRAARQKKAGNARREGHPAPEATSPSGEDRQRGAGDRQKRDLQRIGEDTGKEEEGSGR